MASQDVASASVRDREGIAVDAVASLELAFVVDTPSVVGSVHRLGGLAWVPRVLPSSLLLDHAVTSEEIAHSGSSGPINLGVALLQNREQLLGSPVGVLATEFKDRLGDLDGRFMGASFWPTRTLHQSKEALALKPLDPLVSGGPADPVPPAELRHLERATIVVLDEQPLLIHG